MKKAAKSFKSTTNKQTLNHTPLAPKSSALQAKNLHAKETKDNLKPGRNGCDVKRKLGQNNAESKANGGGPFCKFQLTQTEEVIVRICGMAKSVVGVAWQCFPTKVTITCHQHDRSGKRLQLQAILKS
ncbi:unnamed protein product [Ceratitis capitata]|uniref:(Mediterranean fruit fly) hypothetical protein n=1 Tax=Ceratitis capitata TaxID=7213 RepID=A0A811V789_CERCA|nr:unnamed protein product [Ceratitis capitata]